jgi:hydroxymethylpyrimidine/phosphomethylpyrimidine kinase
MRATDSARCPVALTIAGSDSGGGAGIQADLRTFAFHGIHGTSAITCVTAQNTLGVNRVDALPPEAVAAQIDATVEDIGTDATKTGMLLNADIIATVSDRIETLSLSNLVVDPVMVSRSGAQLIADEAIAALQEKLIPKAAIVTPNRYEAQILGEIEIRSPDDMRVAAERIYTRFGATAVLVKGGGMSDRWRGLDIWYDGRNFETLQVERVDTPHSHGTGCTLSAAIAANLALGADPFSAVEAAKAFVSEALKHSLAIGSGQGPVGHFFALLKDKS